MGSLDWIGLDWIGLDWIGPLQMGALKVHCGYRVLVNGLKIGQRLLLERSAMIAYCSICKRVKKNGNITVNKCRVPVHPILSEELDSVYSFFCDVVMCILL